MLIEHALRRWWQRLRCVHPRTTTIRNVHGDEAMHTGYRSVRRCDVCGKVIFSRELDNSPEAKERTRRWYDEL